MLVDFGYTPEVLLNNMAILKLDPATFDALVLSHGHYDHFGGMVGFLKANKGNLKQKGFHFLSAARMPSASGATPTDNSAPSIAARSSTLSLC